MSETRDNDTEGAAPRRVLVVEDDMLVATMIEDMLAELGIELAGTASDFDRALAMAEQEAFDFAVLDLNIGGQEAYPVADILSARNIPFAFATGYGQLHLREAYRQHPALQKPFRMSDLEAVIARLLAPDDR